MLSGIGESRVLRGVLADADGKTRLLSLIGLSESLGDFLLRYPDHLTALLGEDTAGTRQRILAAAETEQAMLERHSSEGGGDGAEEDHDDRCLFTASAMRRPNDSGRFQRG